MTKLAEQRDFDPEIDLGQFFERCKDKAWTQQQNARWYMRLAKQGYRRAQHRLGCLYAEGAGVPQDYIKAYAWCKVSASQQSIVALIQLREFEACLPPDQIVTARKLSRQYYSTYVAPFSD